MKLLKERLYKHVDFLSDIYPARNHKNMDSIEKAASYIEDEFSELDCAVKNQYFAVGGNEYRNVIASFNTNSKKRLIVGAHYDVCGNTPGADDNGSAVAGLLECARMLHEDGSYPDYRVDFVAYCLEEPPYFGTDNMGSVVHARSLMGDRENVIGMICFEMIGYFSDKKGSQDYPLKSLKNSFPDTGNFIIVGGRNYQAGFAKKITGLLREKSEVPAYVITNPALDGLLSMSDHSSYWKYGFNAVMINDTSMLRNQHYHQESDTIDKLDFDKMTEVVKGCFNAIKNM